MPCRILSSTKENGSFGSSDTSHSDSLHISTAIALMSAPYRHVAMTVRIAWVFSSAGVRPVTASSRSQASTSRSARYLAAATRNAPEPHAMSATLSSRIRSESTGTQPSTCWWGPGS